MRWNKISVVDPGLANHRAIRKHKKYDKYCTKIQLKTKNANKKWNNLTTWTAEKSVSPEPFKIEEAIKSYLSDICSALMIDLPQLKPHYDTVVVFSFKYEVMFIEVERWCKEVSVLKKIHDFHHCPLQSFLILCLQFIRRSWSPTWETTSTFVLTLITSQTIPSVWPSPEEKCSGS